MKQIALLSHLATALLPSALLAAESDKWLFDVSPSGPAAGMSGDVAIGPVDAPVDFGFAMI
jgi:hypothetical protein